MKSRSLLILALLLLIAAALPSCKSPTTPAQSSAFTLILPDSTVAWGDSAVMMVIPAKPLSSSSLFAWTFGDSSSLVSRSDTIIHYYPDTGVFTVKVDLNDTSNKSQLGTVSGTVHVAARHFNLALLQTMGYVDVSWQCRVDTIETKSGSPLYNEPCSPSSTDPLTWSGTNFSAGSSYSQKNQGPSEYQLFEGGDTVYGNVDMERSQLLSFTISEGNSITVADTDNGFVTGWGESNCNATFSAENLPFRMESDSDMVFEAENNFTKSDSDNQQLYDSERFGNETFSIKSNFSDSTVYRYIRIRFHK